MTCGRYITHRFPVDGGSCLDCGFVSLTPEQQTAGGKAFEEERRHAASATRAAERIYNAIIAASGIETEGHDPEEGHGAKHESPTSEAGDAQ